jgi:4-diphosphocytidyl-2-C-methyl-D-erythritol kinase
VALGARVWGRFVRVRVRCPAKVNLHLEVLGRRLDGYHEIRTVFAAVGVWDELVCSDAPDGLIELAVEPVGSAPVGEDNVVVKAARTLAESLGAERGARMVLHKGIPVAGGLGGGSSDAAAALAGLLRLWGSSEPLRELDPLAAGLGADVPFFLVGGIAWGVGTGSDVTPLADLPRWWVVLLPGPEPIPTGEVYGALEPGVLDVGGSAEIYRWVDAGGDLPLGVCRNDLQPTVTKRWPEVGRRLASVHATRPLLGLLSGSGGTVFGLYQDEERARRSAGQLANYGPIVAPLLTREGSLLRPSAMEE